MESTGSACSLLLLLTMAAVSSGRNATEYFQQARFQHSPSRPDDALVFYTATAPPLICELEKDLDWVGGDRLKSDFILNVPGAFSYYTCSFEGNATIRANLKLIQKSLPNVFSFEGDQKIKFNNNGLYCFTDSQLPDEYFHLIIQRPNENRPVKCRKRLQTEKLYLRFPGYPTIICLYQSDKFPRLYRFTLPGIVGHQLECVLQVYSDVETKDKLTEKRLYYSLFRGLPTRVDGEIADVVCSRHQGVHGTAHFQLRLPGDTVYDCSFSDT